MQTVKEVDLTWTLESFYKLGVIVDAQDIITDVDQALKNAVAHVFPHVKHILCFWHILSNVRAKYEGSFPSFEEREPAQRHGISIWSWEEF